MRRTGLLVIGAAMLLAGPVAEAQRGGQGERRCGWWVNPTPGNVWLIDRHDSWTVGAQGGHQAQGGWPHFRPDQWVSTNRSYGYGCACINAVTNRLREVVRMRSAQALPLAQCRRDPNLPRRPF